MNITYMDNFKALKCSRQIFNGYFFMQQLVLVFIAKTIEQGEKQGGGNPYS